MRPVWCQQFRSMRVFIEIGGPHAEVPHWHIGEEPGKHGFLTPCYAPLVGQEPKPKVRRKARDDRAEARALAERVESPLPVVGGRGTERACPHGCEEPGCKGACY